MYTLFVNWQNATAVLTSPGIQLKQNNVRRYGCPRVFALGLKCSNSDQGKKHRLLIMFPKCILYSEFMVMIMYMNKAAFSCPALHLGSQIRL